MVKKRVGADTQVVRVCRNERERVDALREFWGIELSERDQMEIRGLSTEIKEGVERAAVSHALKGIGAGVYLAQTHRIRIFLQLPPPPCYLNRSPFQLPPVILCQHSRS